MTHKTDETQTIYSSSNVATLLNIQESTLRKYCILLEKAGYHFHKNEFGHRGFYDKDVITLRKMIDIKKHPDMTVEQACNAVMVWVKQGRETKADTPDLSENKRYNERDSLEELKKEFQDYKMQQEEFQKELINQLNNQTQYIKNLLEDRDKRLLQSIRETQEAQKQIASAEEQKEEPKEKRKWYQFW